MSDIDFYEKELFFESQRKKKLKKIINGKAGKFEKKIFKFFNSKSVPQLKQELNLINPRINELKKKIKTSKLKEAKEIKKTQKSRSSDGDDMTSTFSATQGAITGNFINLDGNPFTPF